MSRKTASSPLALLTAVLVLLAGTAGMAFAGGSAEKGTPQASSADSLSSVDPSGQTVEFWHNHSQDRETGLNGMIDAFNSSNQWKITVKGEYAGSSNELKSVNRSHRGCPK